MRKKKYDHPYRNWEQVKEYCEPCYYCRGIKASRCLYRLWEESEVKQPTQEIAKGGECRFYKARALYETRRPRDGN